MASEASGQVASVEGRLFDGSASRPLRIRLTPVAGGFDLDFPDGERPRERLAAAAVRWQEPLGAAVRRAELPGGGSCEFPCGAALQSVLAACGHADSPVVRWQRSAAIALGALLVLLGVLFGLYRWGLPAVAEWVAEAVPAEALAGFDRHLLGSLEAGGLLEPSQLPRETRDAAHAASRRLAGRAPELRFHHSAKIGANAFALPGGTIVVTDDLLRLAGSADAVAAVVAHELGHVHHRHGLRQLIQSSAVAVIVGLWIGDFDSMITVASTVLLGSSYSRRFEHEADAFAAQLLLDGGLSPVLLAEVLERLAGDEAADDGHDRYLSSHPPTPERIERLRRLAVPDGARRAIE